MTIRAVHACIVHHRVRISYIIFAALLLEWLSHARPHAIFDTQDFRHMMGAVLMLAGALLRSWAAGVIDKSSALATKGPYALTRHPLYVGSFAIMVGFAALIEDAIALATIVSVIVLIYLPTMRNEESFLADRFGAAWEQYVQCTGVFLPKRRATLAVRWSAQRWYRHREYRALAAVVGILLFWQLWFWDPSLPK